MFIIENYGTAVLFCLVTMLCWGSWANTQKLAASNWRFELFYWDYVIGIFLTALLFALTLGSSGDSGRGFLVDLRQAEGASIGLALLGGAVFNAANILLGAAISIAGMSVAFPVGIGLALVLGVLVNYADNPVGSPAVLFLGVGLVAAAILLNAFAYRRTAANAQGVSGKGLVLSVVAGVLMGFFYRYVAASMSTDFETPEQAEYARALGATLGQGYLFGRPQRRAASGPVTTIPLPIFTAALPHPWRTPFDLASARRPVRHGTMPLLSSITRELERQAADGHRSSLFISSFPETKDARGRLDALYDEFGSDRALAAAADDGGRAHQGMRRGVSIRDDDPLRGTLNVVVIGAHFAAMLAAREGGPAADGHPPVFDFVCTYDRDLIVECAQALMLRIAMSGAGGG